MRLFFFGLLCLVSRMLDTGFAQEPIHEVQIDHILKTTRMEAEAIEALAGAGAKMKDETTVTSRENHQLIFRRMESIGKSDLKRLDQNLGFAPLLGEVPEGREIATGELAKAVREARQVEFLELCKKVSVLQPEMGIRIAGYLCEVEERGGRADFEGPWLIVDEWLKWSLQNLQIGSQDLFLDGYKNSWYSWKRELSLQSFIAYVASQANQEKQLRSYIERIKAGMPKEDGYGPHAVTLLTSAADLYLTESAKLPPLVVQTLRDSFVKQLHFRTPQLITLIKARKLSLNTQMEIARLCADLEHPPTKYFEFVIENTLVEGAEGELAEFISIATDPTKNARFDLIRVLLWSENERLSVEHGHSLVDGAISLGNFCLETYPRDKPHHFYKSTELQKLAELIEAGGDDGDWSKTRKQFKEYVAACEKKFGKAGWFKITAETRKIIGRWTD